jgi:hypothetical protein
MAKRFFYVCTGLFLLALSYHLGATNSVAQVGVVQGPTIDSGGNACAVRNGIYYRFSGGNSEPPFVPPVPTHSPVVATTPSVAILLENGDIYRNEGVVSSWVFKGNLFGGSTNVQKESFGEIKARYR